MQKGKGNMRVARARKANFLTQPELAQKVTKILGKRVTTVAISNIETGVTQDPRMSMKRAIAQALDVQPSDLFPLEQIEDEEQNKLSLLTA